VRRFGPDYQVLSAALLKTVWTPSAGLQIGAVGWHWWRLICGYLT
jgi:hypothetical protein